MTRTTTELRAESEHLTELLDGLLRLSNGLHAAGQHADEMPKQVERLLRALGTDVGKVSEAARSYGAALVDLQDALTRVAEDSLTILHSIERRAGAIEREAAAGAADG